MNELAQLQSLGLELPSTLYIVGAVLFGVLGLVAFRRGRKASKTPMIIAGLALMLYPYAVLETWLLWAVGAALFAWIFTK